ncbi:MAG: hypothetical protein RR439_08800 [Carnobacterium sp.]
MGKFNFESYQENISNRQLSMTDFKPIKPGGFGGGRKENKPVISISRHSISANSSATKILIKKGKYVEFMVHGGLLAMRILNKKLNIRIHLTLTKRNLVQAQAQDQF